MVVVGAFECQDTIHGVSGHYCSVLLGCLLCLAHGDDFREGQVLQLEKVLDGAPVVKAFDDLVLTDLFHTLIVTERACFAMSQSDANKSLNNSPGCCMHRQKSVAPPIHFCNLYIPLDGVYHQGDLASLILREAQMIGNSESFVRKHKLSPLFACWGLVYTHVPM